MFMGDFDWKLIKAMCYQESSFRPLVVSSAGAQGLCQLMPDTFRFITDRVGMKGANVFKEKDNIYASVAYFSWIWDQWSSKRTDYQRAELTLASYNAGLGNILRAQRTCENSLFWEIIKQCLVNVTGERNSHETIDYVDKIKKWRIEIERCDAQLDQGARYSPFVELIGKLYYGFDAIKSWIYQSSSSGGSIIQQGQCKNHRGNSWLTQTLCGPGGINREAHEPGCRGLHQSSSALDQKALRNRRKIV